MLRKDKQSLLSRKLESSYMKGKDKKALQSKTVAELGALLGEKRTQLNKVSIDLRLNKVKNVHAAWALRKEIAMIQTAKREQELIKEAKNG